MDRRHASGVWFGQLKLLLSNPRAKQQQAALIKYLKKVPRGQLDNSRKALRMTCLEWSQVSSGRGSGEQQYGIAELASIEGCAYLQRC